MERKFLEDLGLEKESIEKIMIEHGKARHTLEKEVETLTAEIENKKTELSTANEAIKGFDGVNVEEIKGKITQYETEMKIQAEKHQKELNDIQFNNVLERSLTGAKAKNTKAVKALLDMEGLKLDGDKIIGFDDVLKPIMADNPYLFDVDETTKPGFLNAPLANGGNQGQTNMEEQIKNIMGTK